MSFGLLFSVPEELWSSGWGSNQAEQVQQSLKFTDGRVFARKKSGEWLEVLAQKTTPNTLYLKDAAGRVSALVTAVKVRFFRVRFCI